MKSSILSKNGLTLFQTIMETMEKWPFEIGKSLFLRSCSVLEALAAARVTIRGDVSHQSDQFL